MSKTCVAIIGGGACGVSAFIEFVIQLISSGRQQQVKIILIERRGVIGEGLAFGTKQLGHLLNTRADLMGIHPNEPGHYSEWLVNNKHLVGEEDLKAYEDPDDAYTTRHLYSRYLQDQFNHHVEVARINCVEFEVIFKEVLDIFPDNEGYRLKIENAPSVRAEYVLLAPGTPKPANFSELEQTDKYIDFPWPSKNLVNIPSDAAVGILGSGLSAIDAVMTLADNHHRGTIQLFSPDGYLPRVQPKQETNYRCTYLTLANVNAIRRKSLRSPRVAELFRLFQKEVSVYTGKDVNWQEAQRKGKSAEDLLREDIRIARAGGDALINIVYALRQETTPIWQMMSAHQQLLFKKWFGADWMITRHAMPMYNARKLQRLFHDKRLEVFGELDRVSFDENKGGFDIKARQQSRFVQYLINATGPATMLNEMKSILIQNLFASKMIIPYEVGGIHINPKTMQVLSPLKTSRNMYCVGHLCNGMLMDVNAVWFNVKTISSMIQDFMSRLSRRDHF